MGKGTPDKTKKMCVSKIKQNCFCKCYLILFFPKVGPVSGASMHLFPLIN